MAKAKRSGSGLEKGAEAEPVSRAEKTPRPRAPAAPRRAPDPDALNVLRPSRPRSRANGRAQSADAARQATPERGNRERPPVVAAASSGAGASADAWALPPSVRERFGRERRGC